MTDRLRHILAVLALAALLPASAAATPADTTERSVAAEKTALLRMLNADSVEKQELAVRRIGTYAHTGRYDDDFYRILVTPLHGLVATGETEAIRIMAVSALYSIGTERAMQGLQAQVDSLRPERVKTLTRSALTEYAAARTARRPQ